MNQILEELGKIGIVPVIALDDAKDAKPLAEALMKGGLPCAEVTFRTAAAEESIRIISENFPDMLVGAGTVLTTEQVDRAVNAGAKFIVSPGFNRKIVEYCIGKGIPVTPGTCTPSDIERFFGIAQRIHKRSLVARLEYHLRQQIVTVTDEHIISQALGHLDSIDQIAARFVECPQCAMDIARREQCPHTAGFVAVDITHAIGHIRIHQRCAVLPKASVQRNALEDKRCIERAMLRSDMPLRLITAMPF